MYGLTQLVEDSSKVVLSSADGVIGEDSFEHVRFPKARGFAPLTVVIDVRSAVFTDLAVEALAAVMDDQEDVARAQAADALGLWMVFTQVDDGLLNGLWLLKRLADVGYANSMLNWAVCMLARSPSSTQAREAVHFLRCLLADPRVPDAQMARVWSCYADALLVGEGCERDGALALSFLMRAVDANFPGAFLSAAFCLASPDAVGPEVVNLPAAVRLLERGAVLGAPGCRAYLGILHLLDCFAGARWERGLSLLRMERLDGSEQAGFVLDQVEGFGGYAEVPALVLESLSDIAGRPGREEDSVPDAGAAVAALAPVVPVLTCESLQALLSVCHVARDFPAFAEHGDAFLASVATFPAGMAFSIARLAPQLADATGLRLLVLGAGICEVGSIFELLPVFLGRPALRVEVSLVGPSLSELPADGVFGHRSVFPRCYVGSAAEFLDEFPNSVFDAVFVPQPGMESHAREWLEDGEDVFETFINAGVPVLGCSYAEDDALVDAEVLSLYGYGLSAPVANPLVGESLPIATAYAFVWAFLSKGAALSSDLLETRLDLIEQAREVLSPFSLSPGFDEVAGDEIAAMGSVVALSVRPGVVRLYWRLVRGLVVNAEGDVYRVFAGRLVGTCEASLPARLVRSMPVDGDGYIKRLLWAASVWHAVVLPRMALDPQLAFHTYVGGHVLPCTDELEVLASIYDVDLNVYIEGLGL